MPSPRPGSVTAAGVMAIIYGSMFTLCGLCGVGMAVRGTMDNAGNDPMAAQLQKQAKQVQEALVRDAPAYQVVQIIATIASLSAALSLLIAGIGLMNMRRWARTLALAGCLIAIATTLSQTAYQLVYVMPITSKIIEADLPAAMPQGGGPQADEALKIAKIVQSMVGVLIVALNVVLVIYLLVIVFLLCRRQVRAAFAAQEGAAIVERPIDEERRFGDEEDDQGWNQPAPR